MATTSKTDAETNLEHGTGAITRYKGAIIEKVVDKKTKREGVVRLDKNFMTFYAVDRDAWVASKDGRAVTHWLESRLRQSDEETRLDWRPVIEVANRSGDRYAYGSSSKELSASCAVAADRYYLALTKDETKWLKLSWADADPDSPTRLKESAFIAKGEFFKDGPKARDAGRYDKPFSMPSVSGNTFYLPYDAELWAGLVLLAGKLDEQVKLLKTLLSTKEGHKTLRAAGANGLLRLGAAGE